jgi:hypothetical protein
VEKYITIIFVFIEHDLMQDFYCELIAIIHIIVEYFKLTPIWECNPPPLGQFQKVGEELNITTL